MGSAETGRSLAAPYQIAHAEPLAWKGGEDHAAVKASLAQAVKAKWAEATTGPPHAHTHALEGGELGGDENLFRHLLLAAQNMCSEVRPVMEAAGRLLAAAQGDSTRADESTAKDHHINP